MNQICLWRHFCRYVHTSVPGKEMIEIVSLKATSMFEDQWSTVKYIKLFQRHVIPVTNLQKLQKKFGSIFLLCSISIRIWLTIKSAWLLVVLVSAGQMLKSPQQSFDKKNKTAYHWRKEETGNGASIKQFWYNALSEQIWSNWKSTTLEQYVVATNSRLQLLPAIKYFYIQTSSIPLAASLGQWHHVFRDPGWHSHLT